MPKQSPLINIFSSGEISPCIDARSDFPRYYSGCRTLKNMFPHLEGGAFRMPGTYYVGKTKWEKTRFIPFHFSTIQAYILEFGDRYIRFYKDNGIILGNGSAYEISTPYLEDDLFKLKFVQSADVMYLFHPDYPPKKLSRTGHTAWTLTNFVGRIQNPFIITAATKANPCVITVTYPDTAWETAFDYVEGNIVTHDISHYYCLIAHKSELFSTDLSNHFWAVMDFPVAGDIVYIKNVEGMVELNDKFYTVANPSGKTFNLGIDSSAYTAYTSGGTAQKTVAGTPDHCPSCGTFFGQRLIISGMNDHPQTLFASATADYEDFTLDGNDDSAGVEYTLMSEKVDRIRWVIGEDYLILGTTGGIWMFDLPATPTTDPPYAKKHVYIGAADIDPQTVGDSIFWVTRSGLSLRQLTFDIGIGKYRSLDMTKLAKHITQGPTMALSGIKEMAYQQEPVQILWAVRTDGQLLGFLCNLQEEIFAWFRVVTDGLFKSVAVISKDSYEDQVWVVVDRNE